jgi:hypothetical protein
MTAPNDTRIRRWLRRFALGSGPLKRRSDRIQLIGRLAVALSFLVAPVLGVAAASAATAHLQAVAAAEAADRSRASAVLLEDAPTQSVTTTYSGTPWASLVPVRAVWPVAGGPSREGFVLAQPRTPAGTAVPVWVNREGSLTGAPPHPTGSPASAAAMGTLPLIGVPLATWILYALLCFVLDAHRERRWAQDWAAVEPDWTSRPH